MKLMLKQYFIRKKSNNMIITAQIPRTNLNRLKYIDHEIKPNFYLLLYNNYIMVIKKIECFIPTANGMRFNYIQLILNK